jgi:hypothetical protein
VGQLEAHQDSAADFAARQIVRWCSRVAFLESGLVLDIGASYDRVARMAEKDSPWLLLPA